MTIDHQIQAAVRAAVNSYARTLVLKAYRSVEPSVARPQAQFAAALECYCDAYPQVPAEIARHAVAYIISTYGMPDRL